MVEEPDRGSHGDPTDTRAGRRRMRREFMRRIEQERASRDAYLDEQLEPGEQILARSLRITPTQPTNRDSICIVVTDRRILFSWMRPAGPHQGEWIHDALRYSEIERWTLGSQHDGRPLIVVDHPAHVRLEHVHDKRTLFLTHGTAEGPVEHTRTTFPGGSNHHPVFVAMREQLERANIPKGEQFQIRPERSREERLGPVGYYLKASRFSLRLAGVRMRRIAIRWRT